MICILAHLFEGMLCKPREESGVSGDVCFFLFGGGGGGRFFVLFDNKHVRPFFFWGGGGGWEKRCAFEDLFGNDDGLMVGGVCLVCACQHH